MSITITEALAEIPTIEKRIAKKQEFVINYLFRISSTRDPHEKDGGSGELIRRELQAIDDLQIRLVTIRAAIQAANVANTIVVDSTVDTIANWLVWRREIAPKMQAFYANLAGRINQLRQAATRQGVSVKDTDAGVTNDYIVNINEKALAVGIEHLETVLGILDGQLSLKNATITLDT